MAQLSYSDIVRVLDDAPVGSRAGQKGWIVGISEERDRSGAYRQKFPVGTVYTVEFEDGYSLDVHEEHLRRVR